MSKEGPTPLANQCVSFTGRSLCFNRLQARQVVERLGGCFRHVVSCDTSLLVVGAAGWPLQKNGRLTKNLELAHRLRSQGCAIQIESEEDFLERIGSPSVAGARVHTLAQLSRLFSLSAQQLNAWHRIGLLCPTSTENDVAYYDFPQVVRCRTLAELAGTKIGRRRLYRVIKQLRSGGLTDSMLDRLIISGSQLAIRSADGLLHTPRGQQLIDFSSAENSHVALPAIDTGDSDFDRGVELEHAGRLEEAEQVYRNILTEHSDDSDVLYNLANVLVEQGRVNEAVKLYRDAIYYDSDFAEAWNNLGNALADSKKPEEAILAYRQALRIDPDFSSPMFGIACALEACGRPYEATPHWRKFIAYEPAGQQAEYARRRLQSI